MSSDYPWYTDHACTLLFDTKYSLTTTFTLTHSGSDGLEIVTAAGPAGTKGGVNAYGISMRWQATDLIAAAVPTATSASTTLTPRVIASETSAPTQTQSPVTPLPELSSNALSGGAIAGIVIGVIALVALIAGGTWFFLQARKSNDETPKTPILEVGVQGGRESGVTEYFLPKGEQSVGHQRQVLEMFTPAQTAEVEGSVVSHDMPTARQRSPVEMP
jgi:hypothetical protein